MALHSDAPTRYTAVYEEHAKAGTKLAHLFSLAIHNNIRTYFLSTFALAPNSREVSPLCFLSGVASCSEVCECATYESAFCVRSLWIAWEVFVLLRICCTKLRDQPRDVPCAMLDLYILAKVDLSPLRTSLFPRYHCRSVCRSNAPWARWDYELAQRAWYWRL